SDVLRELDVGWQSALRLLQRERSRAAGESQLGLAVIHGHVTRAGQRVEQIAPFGDLGIVERRRRIALVEKLKPDHRAIDAQLAGEKRASALRVADLTPRLLREPDALRELRFGFRVLSVSHVSHRQPLVNGREVEAPVRSAYALKGLLISGDG